MLVHAGVEFVLLLEILYHQLHVLQVRDWLPSALVLAITVPLHQVQHFPAFAFLVQKLLHCIIFILGELGFFTWQQIRVRVVFSENIIEVIVVVDVAKSIRTS